MKYLYDLLATFLERTFHVDAKYFLSGGFWLSLTQATTILGGLITSVLFARYLDPTDYGIYRYLIGLAAIFSAFSLTGLGQAILQTAAKKYYSFYSETLRTNFLYSTGISVMSIAGGVYYFLNDNLTLAAGCLLIAVLQPFVITFSNSISYLQGRGRYRDSTIVQAGKTIVITAVGVTAVSLSDNIIILFTVFLGGQLITNYVAHILYQPGLHAETPKEVFSLYKSYALHTSWRNIIDSVASRADTVIVFTQLGAADLAIYTIATLLPEQIKAAFKNLSTLLLPKYAKRGNLNINNNEVFKRSTQLFIILCFIAVVYVLAAPLIYPLLFPKYPEAVFYSQLSALAFPSFITLIPLALIQSRLDKKALYKINVQNAVVGTVAILFFTLHYGIAGAITARIITRYINAFYAYYKLQR